MQWPRATVSSLTALAVLAGAVGLGAAQNVIYIKSLGTDLGSSAVWIGLAILSGLLKLRIPATPKWRRDPLLLGAFAAALAFDIFCAFGHGAQTRGTKLETYAAERARGASLASEVSRLETELSAIKVVEAPNRPSSALRAQLESVKASSGCMRDEHRNQCPVILGQIKTDLASAISVEAQVESATNRREIVSHELSKARESLKSFTPPAHPDPQAAWIAATFGTSERFAASWQTVLGMLILELGVVAGAIMLERSQDAPPRRAEPTSPKQPNSPPKRGQGAEHALETLRRVASGQITAVGLTVAGSTITGSQTALALACGCSQPTIGRWLQELDTAGKLRVGKVGRLTTVKVV